MSVGSVVRQAAGLCFCPVGAEHVSSPHTTSTRPTASITDFISHNAPWRKGVTLVDLRGQSQSPDCLSCCCFPEESQPTGLKQNNV